MAGDWIKFDTATIDKPEVWELSDALERTPETVLGHLLRFWVWADKQTADGVTFVTQLTTIDRVANCTGFGQALLSTGWLVAEKGGFTIPKFMRHNGKSAKKRALAKDRQEEFRSRSPRNTRNARVTRSPLPEKRRELPILNTKVVDERAVDKPGGDAPFTDLLKTSKGNGEARAPTPAKPTPEPKPGEGAKVVPAPGNGQIDKDWASTPEGIEHAAKTFGMERLPFETDEALAQRVNARRALG